MSDTTVRPCWHMTKAVNQMAEGKSQGLWLQYARAHVARCPQCQAALDALINYLETVKAAKATPTSQEFDFDRLESAFDNIDSSDQNEPKPHP